MVTLYVKKKILIFSPDAEFCVFVFPCVCASKAAGDTYIWTCEPVHVCTTQAMHAPHNIISRNIISHIAVMTLGRYVDYTVGKQQPADWVRILPYITSLHSSLCFFLLPSFFQITSHFPSFLGEVPGYASR